MILIKKMEYIYNENLWTVHLFLVSEENWTK